MRCVFKGLFEDRSKLWIGCQEGKRSLSSYHHNIHEDGIIHPGLFYHDMMDTPKKMDDGPWQCYVKFWARKLSPRKKKAGEHWLAFHHHMGHRIEVTIQYLTILVEPSKRSKESKKTRCFFGLFRGRPLEMCQEVNGSCSLDLNSQEIKKNRPVSSSQKAP